MKLADFGLARQLYQKRNYTVRVCTLWYKPPELLLGKKNYNTKVDMWSLGCFLAELLLKKPLFHKADSERRLVAQIFKLCGPPTEETWPEAHYFILSICFICLFIFYYRRVNWNSIRKWFQENPMIKTATKSCKSHRTTC